MCSVTGLYGIVPVHHMLSSYGWETADKNLGMTSLVWMAVSYVGGAVIYMLRVPERFFPGRCDIVVSSLSIV